MKIKVKAGASVGGLQIMECWEYEDGKRVGSKFVNVAHLKSVGAIKRANSFGKAEAFLNTEEGLAFYKETPNTSIF